MASEPAITTPEILSAAPTPKPSPGKSAPGRTAPGTPPPPPAFKYRFRFRKAGDLRLVSHHDLLHVFERLFRRADLPVPFSKGFNPRPRIWFAQSLALGIVGENEVLEIELREPMSADELRDRLNRFLPPGIEILAARDIPPRGSAQVRRAFFRLVTREPLAGAELEGRIAKFLATPLHLIVRTRPQKRRFNIRPYVEEIKIAGGYLEMSLWVTPHGSARPEEIVTALGLADHLEEGAYLARTDLELYDEAPDPTPPALPTMLHPSKEEFADLDASESDEEITPERTVAPQPTSLMANPLSFDS